MDMDGHGCLCRDRRLLILFTGLPGTGKTSLARRLAAHLCIPLFAKDRLQSSLREQGLTGRSGTEGYRLILALADEQLGLGVSAILDGVFPRAGFREEARQIAENHSALSRVIYCMCSDENLWKQRMVGRAQLVPHWSPVGWEEVERLRDEFEPWREGEALRIDAADTQEYNFARLLDWINVHDD